MIFQRMTATFGKLERETLELHDGLNIITAPNESGKSTWASFLLAMLYGVDSSERATKTNLPAKTKYKPWSGQAMEGRLELRQQGRNITIERESQGRTAMGQFHAYDTDTGKPLDFLREDGCGQALLGVERSVYERSGFIRQQGIALSGDHALEARLNALVTTGDETVSYGQTAQRLKDLRNRRRHNRTGLLPQAEAELEQVQAALDSIAQLGRDTMALAARREALEAEKRELSQIAAALRAQETAEKRQRLEAARLNWEKQKRFLAEKRETVKGLPELEPLQDLLRELDILTETGKALEADLRLGVAQPQAPECPPVFARMDADQVRSQAEADAAQLEHWQDRRQYSPRSVWLLLWIAVCTLAIGVAGLALSQLPLACAGFALCAFSAVLAILRRGKNRRALEAQRQILARYQTQDAAGIHRAANNYREALLLYLQKSADAAEKHEALDHRQEAFSTQQSQLLLRVQAFAPSCETPAAARAAVQQAVHRQQFYLAAQRETQQALTQYEAVRSALGELPECPVAEPVSTAGCNLPQISARLDAVRQELQDVRSQLDLRRGRMEAAGDPAALAARREQLSGRIARLQLEYDALTAAMEALDSANDTLQTRFSPRLNELASQYMAQMTGGRYDRVLLGQDLSVTAREAGAAVSRQTLALSAGTADQLYLAVRLAICRLALPEDAPLVLDDALVAFDDARMGSALSLLRELAKTRQILLFTCQQREADWLAAH